MNHEHSNSSQSQEQSTDHHGSSGVATDLFQSATRLAGGNATFRFGRDQFRTYAQERCQQIERLLEFPTLEIDHFPLLGTGGEHIVRAQKLEAQDRVLKTTLPGFYGRTMDEDYLLNPRTFSNNWKLKLRDALPCEYLARWAVLEKIFSLQSTFEGICINGAEPQMVISQPFVGIRIPEEEDVEDLMLAMRFEKVDVHHIINPENTGCTWYRQEDGILITDAFPRNFRIDAATEAVLPIDLMVNLVPPDGSKLLQGPSSPFTLPPTLSLL